MEKPPKDELIRKAAEKVKSPGPETAPTLGERAKKIPTDEGWDFGYWWAHQDSNLEPKDYESSALTIEL